MYGQAERRRTGEMRIVNRNQLDRWSTRKGRRRRHGRFHAPGRGRKSAFRRAVSILLLIFLILAAGFFSGVRFVMAVGTSQENVFVLEPQPLGGAEEASGENAGEVVLPEEQEPKTPLVVIDPGHGGNDDGCVRDGVAEKEINLQLALLLAEKLQDMGIDAVLTREDNETYLSLEERVQFAEDQDGDVLVSIHQNSYGEKDNSVEGIETWYSETNQNSRQLARLVNMGAVDKTGARERELVVGWDLYVIREAPMPSCLIETGFLTNKKEREAICDSAYQDKVAEGIAWGIRYYFFPEPLY